MRMPKINVKKKLQLGVAISVLGLGIIGYKANEWNRNRLDVLNSTKAWKEYSTANAISGDRIDLSSTEAERLKAEILDSTERTEGTTKHNLWYLNPKDYTESTLGFLLIANDETVRVSDSIFAYEREITEREPLRKGSDLRSKIDKDVRILRQDPQVKRKLESYFGKGYDVRVLPTIVLTAITGRVSESIIKGFSPTYELRVETGLLFDNDGYSRKKLLHQWTRLNGEIIDNAPRKLVPDRYIPLTATTMIAEKKESYLVPNQRGNTILLNTRSVFYVKPNKN